MVRGALWGSWSMGSSGRVVHLASATLNYRSTIVKWTYLSRGGQEHETWHASTPMNHLARGKEIGHQASHCAKNNVARRKYRGCLCAARSMNHSAYRKFAQKVARGVCMASHDQRIAQRKIAQKFARGVCMASHDQRNILRNESTRSVYGRSWRNVSSFGGALWNPWSMRYQFAWFT